MSELLREIEEDIRSERLERLWNKFGKTAIHASIAVIIGTAIGVAWQHYRQSVTTERTSQLLHAGDHMRQGDYQAAVVAYDKLDAASIHGHLAALGKAGALEAQGDKAAAYTIYANLAKQSSRDPFVDLGTLLAAKETDSPLHASRDSAFYYSASEMRGWQLLKSGKKTEAVAIFSILRDDQDAPTATRARARMIAEYLEAK